MQTAFRVFLLFFLTTSLAQYAIAQDPLHHNPSEESLADITRLMLSFNPENGAQLPVYFVQLDDIKARIDALCPVVLNSSAPMPASHTLSCNKVLQIYDSVQSIILQKMAVIERVMYESGLDALARKDSAEAENLFVRSLQHDPSYAPAAYSLVHLLLRPGTAIRSAAYLTSFLPHISEAENPYNYHLLLGLAPAILDSIIAYSDTLISKDLSLDAIDLLLKAESYPLLFSSSDGREALSRAKTRAHHGMFSSYLRIAERAMATRRWELAIKYFQEAGKYQQANTEFLTTDNLWKEGLSKVLLKQEEKHLLSQSSENEQEASKPPIVDPASVKRKTHPRPGEKVPKSKDAEVTKLLTLSDSLIFQGKYREALVMIKYADSLQITRHLALASLIRGLFQDAAKPLLLDTIRAAFYTAWRNEITRAKSIAATCKNWQQVYYLAEDKEVSQAVAELELRIQERQCFTDRSDYEAAVYRSLSKFAREEYLEGDDYLQIAAAAAERNPSCGISDSLLARTQKKYGSLILWQKHWSQAQQAFSLGKMDIFLAEYQEAWTIYSANNLKDKGVTIKAPESFVVHQHDPQLTRSFLWFITEAGQYREVCAYTQTWNEEVLPAAIKEEILVNVGQHMARHDMAMGGQDWESYLQTLGKPGKVVKKAYFRTIKTLKK